MPSLQMFYIPFICLVYPPERKWELSYSLSLLMYDVHNNLVLDNIKNMFTKLASVHSYQTRSVTSENYYVEQVRTENLKRAFSISRTLI